MARVLFAFMVFGIPLLTVGVVVLAAWLTARLTTRSELRKAGVLPPRQVQLAVAPPQP